MPVSTNFQCDDYDRLRELTFLAQIGWWEANFTTRTFRCSEYICDLLKLENDEISFNSFSRLIRQDYYERTKREFISLSYIDAYDQTYPFLIDGKEIWIHSHLGSKKMNETGELIAFGYIRQVEGAEKDLAVRLAIRTNEQLARQNSISQSLYYFIQETDATPGINNILNDILQFFQGDRAYIFEYDEECKHHSCIFEVLAEGVKPEIDILQNIPAQQLPWWTERILSGQPIVLNSVEDLKEEAPAEFDILSRQNIKSLLVVPLKSGERIRGYLGIDLVKRIRVWSNDDCQWLSSLANIISICTELRNARDEAKHEQAFMHNLFHYMPIGYIHISIVRGVDGKPVDYLVTDTNQMCTDLMGIPNTDYIGKYASELHTNYQHKLNYIADIIDGNGYKELEVSFPVSGKNSRCIVYSPEKDEIVALFVDITETEQAHKALDRSEKLLSIVFANIPVGIEIYDQNGFMIDINNKDMEIFGVRDKADVLGVNVFDNPNIGSVDF